MPVDDFNGAGRFDPERTSRLFNLVIGQVLLNFGEISQEDYDLVGEVQARTIVIRELMDEGGEPVAQEVMERFGKRDRESKELIGKLDLTDVAFMFKPDDILEKLDAHIAEIAELANVDDVDAKVESALKAVENAINNEGSVRSDAAAIVGLQKGLFLQGKERADIPAACLMMQHSIRFMGVVRNFEMNPTDVEMPKAVRDQNNKFFPGHNDPGKGYWADDQWVQRVHGSLRGMCEMHMSLVDRNPMPPENMMMDYYKMQVIAGMEQAAQRFETHGRQNLAQQARSLREFFAKDLLHYDATQMANANPAAIEAMEAQAGNRGKQNSPGAYLVDMAVRR